VKARVVLKIAGLDKTKTGGQGNLPVHFLATPGESESETKLGKRTGDVARFGGASRVAMEIQNHRRHGRFEHRLDADARCGQRVAIDAHKLLGLGHGPAFESGIDDQAKTALIPDEKF
jgi:hypothetical protein